jgi:hypothetical protein
MAHEAMYSSAELLEVPNCGLIQQCHIQFAELARCFPLQGTTAEQDTRFSNKEAKLLKSHKHFAPDLDKPVSAGHRRRSFLQAGTADAAYIQGKGIPRCCLESTAFAFALLLLNSDQI